MQRIRIIVIAALLAMAVLGMGLRILLLVEIDETGYLGEVAPDIAFTKTTGNYHISDSGLVAFNTYKIVPGIRGYAGPIKLLLALGADGRIKGIRILEHSETLNYVRPMEGPVFLGQFIGKHISDPFVIDDDLDGISRATVSAEALAKTARESSQTAGKDVFGIATKESKASPGIDFAPIAYLTVFGFSLAGYYFTKSGQRADWWRDISLCLGIAVIGAWLSSPFSIMHAFNILLLKFSSSFLWIALTASVFFSIALAGRFYCGWLCPFGALSEFIGRLPIRKWEIPSDIEARWRRFKYPLLIGLGALALFTGKSSYAGIEPYVTLFSFSGNIMLWAIAVLGLLGSIWVRRFFCRYFCPVGALSAVLSRKADGYPSSPECPMANPALPDISECIRCNRCRTRKKGE